MTDDWMDNPEVQAAALEGWMNNPVAQAYEAALSVEPGLTGKEFLARCTPAPVIFVPGPDGGHLFNYDDLPADHERFARLATEEEGSRMGDLVGQAIDSATQAFNEALNNLGPPPTKSADLAANMIDTDPYDRRSDVGTTTSTSYTSTLVGAGGAEVEFVAPDDGEVWITSRCQLANSGSGMTLHSVELRDQSGFVAIAVSDHGAVCTAANVFSDEKTTSVERRVTGLKPRRRYTARQMFRVSGGTGTVGARRIRVGREPEQT